MSKLRTHIVIHEYFLLYFIPKNVAKLEEAEAPCFMKNASLPGPQKVKCFRVRFRFQLLSSKCLRFHKNLTASTSCASTSLVAVVHNGHECDSSSYYLVTPVTPNC